MSFANLVTSRLTFGLRFNDPQPVPSDPTAWFKAQLTAPAADDPAVTSRLSQVQLPMTTVDASNNATTVTLPLTYLNDTPEQLWAIPATDTSANHALSRRPADEVIAANWTRGTFSPWQLHEVMTDFWHNHFSVDAYQSSTISVMWPAYDQILRVNGLGNFRTMLGQRYLGEVAPAGTESTGYSDADVQNAARVLTGWTIADGHRTAGDGSKPNSGDFIFSPGIHDTGTKTLFGQTYPTGVGQAEGERFLDYLAGHPGTAQTIATKLYIHFVQDVPPANDSLINAMAASFQANVASPTQISGVLSLLFGSPEFAASAGQKVKNPFPFLVSLLRVSGAEINPVANLEWGLSSLGAPLFQWSTPNGMPDTAAAWTGTNDMLRRWALASQVTSESSKILVDGRSTLFAQIGVGLASPSAVVDRLTPILFPTGLSAASQQALYTYAATPEILGGKGALANPQTLLIGVRALVGAMAATPEFQTR
jgi:uncharacterized protein (DUF1800 family)